MARKSTSKRGSSSSSSRFNNLTARHKAIRNAKKNGSTAAKPVTYNKNMAKQVTDPYSNEVKKNDNRTWRLGAINCQALNSAGETGGYSNSEYTEVSDNIGNIYVTSVSENTRTRVTQHPIESGEHRSDMKVYEPMTVSVRGYVKYDDAEKVRTALHGLCVSGTGRAYYRLGYAVVVHTAYARIGNEASDTGKMFTLESYTMSTEPDKYDVYTVSLQLKELMVTSTSSAKTGSAENSSTVKK